MRPDPREQLATGTVLLDGGLGVELVNACVELEPERVGFTRSPDLLSITRPELVREVHASFRDAGADWLTTNTFGCDPASLERLGLEARRDEILRASVRLCREVAGDNGLVLGTVGPGPLNGAATREASTAFLEGLLCAGVDGLLLETQVDGAHVLELLELLELRGERVEEPSPFVAVSLVVDESGQLPACRSLSEAEFLARLAEHGVGLLGLNCSNGCAPLRTALSRLRELWAGPLGAYPNAGVPELATDGSMLHPIGPREFARELRRLQAEFDLSLIGGCCGASPAHIRALRESTWPE